MSRFVVTGAYGWIGRYVSSTLFKWGEEVLGIDKSRPNDLYSDLFYNADIRNVLTDDNNLMRFVQESVCLVHCAGLAHKVPRNEREEREFFDVNSTGTRNIIDLCNAASIPRIVYVSTISVYDWGSVLTQADEESPVLLDNAYAKSKFEGERFVRESGLDWRIARLATVYGAGDRANFWKLSSALKHRRFILPGKGVARKSVLPITLAAKLLVRMAMQEEVVHRIINIALLKSPDLREIVQAFCEQCGFKTPMSLPVPVLSGLGLCGDLLSRFFSDFPFTSTSLSKLIQDTVVSTARMQESLGSFDYGSFADNLSESVSYYQDE
ncbi:MAG: NAD-dependent epimerase/dehydratase family protein [Thermodesulfobacteriota bacterium]|nr:NAD-dependent epimerase/dehydratase family protein [Thermodesulfobacteriota bacterium]